KWILKKRTKTKPKTTKPNTDWKRSKKTESFEAKKSKPESREIEILSFLGVYFIALREDMQHLSMGDFEASSDIVEPLRIENPFLEDQFQEDTKDPPVVTMTDNRTMAEMLRAPTEGYAEAIIVPPILAEQFELKHSLINMMTSEQFFGLEKDNPHDHIRWGSLQVA
nr:reverse transcriptase domain-containing protein [Tanacetum cinerariifolium]